MGRVDEGSMHKEGNTALLNPLTPSFATPPLHPLLLVLPTGFPPSYTVGNHIHMPLQVTCPAGNSSMR